MSALAFFAYDSHPEMNRDSLARAALAVNDTG